METVHRLTTIGQYHFWCSVSKVLERLIFDRVIVHVLPFITTSQFGFIKNRSTVQQLLTLLNTAFIALNDKRSVDVIYFDIKKAFDSVHHNTLLSKLKLFGISGSYGNGSTRI